MKTLGYFLVVLVCLTAFSGCASLLPTSHQAAPLAKVQEETTEQMWWNARVALMTGNTVAAVKDQTIHEVREVKLGCGELLARCYQHVPFWAKALGGFAMACTEYEQLPGARKVAMIYHCALTDPLTMSHEREHAKGRGDAL